MPQITPVIKIALEVDNFSHNLGRRYPRQPNSSPKHGIRLRAGVSTTPTTICIKIIVFSGISTLCCA